jgi:RNA polymerase sigma-70 factor (ECF subfamily)
VTTTQARTEAAVPSSARRAAPSADDAHDRALADRIRLGDRAALSELYDRHSPTARAIAMRIVGDPRVAEDAVLECFVSLWASIEQLGPAERSVHGWLYGLVRDTAFYRGGRA